MKKGTCATDPAYMGESPDIETVKVPVPATFPVRPPRGLFRGDVMGTLLDLRAATDAALADAQTHKKDFDGDGINWVNLVCVESEAFYDSNGDGGYRVWIEELSSSAHSLEKHVRHWLAAHGWPDVEVRTEW